MLRIDYKDLVKAMKVLERDSLQGPIRIDIDGIVLKLSSMDKEHKDLTIELTDIEYGSMPRLTKTETI